MLTLLHLQTEPYVFKNKTSGEWQGFCIDILEKIRIARNFTYKLHYEGKTGKKQKDGTWTGVMGKLIAGVCLHELCCYKT